MFFRAVGPGGGKSSCHSAVGNSWLPSWLNDGRQEMEQAEMKNAERERERGSFEKSSLN